jgi:hypothetical protein
MADFLKKLMHLTRQLVYVWCFAITWPRKNSEKLNYFSATKYAATLYVFLTQNSRAPVPTDSVSAVYRGPKKNWKIKEINGS